MWAFFGRLDVIRVLESFVGFVGFCLLSTAAGQGNDKTVEDVQAILRYRERTMSKIREDCLGIIQIVSSSSCKFPIISPRVAKWFS